MNWLSGITVSAAELVRNFAQRRTQALETPVYVTNHGRRTHVLLGMSLFQSLSQASIADAAPPEQRSETEHEFAEWSDEAAIFIDAMGAINVANRNAHAICRRPLHSLDHKQLLTALPEMEGTLLEAHYRHVAASHEPAGADIPSPFTPSTWIKFKIFPIRGEIALVMRDITKEAEQYRLGDIKTAMMEAMGTHQGIGYVRVSPTGAIDHVGDGLCQMLGLAKERLAGISVVDLADRADRSEFRTAIDQAVRGNRGSRLVVRLIARGAETIDAVAAIAPLRGDHGAEGAVILITRQSDDPA